MKRFILFILVSLSALGAARAQSGSFIIPSIRAAGGTDFAYWDFFARPPGSSVNSNYQHANPPALADGFGEDDDGNATTAFAPRATLTQDGTPNAFVTSSAAIYSFSDPLAFTVHYEAPTGTAGEITNLIFQTQSGGARLNVNAVFLRYEDGDQTFELAPTLRALDDPQTGAFSERIVCAFQWNLTGLNIRSVDIVFTTPVSMPLWQAQLDAVIGSPFVQELGYLLTTVSRPITRFGIAGAVDKNLPISVDDRYFQPGDLLTLLSDPEPGWAASGWHYANSTSTGASLPLTFPAQDIIVTALFAPENYLTWRETMFFHANALLDTDDDYLDDAISAPTVNPDGDLLENAGEYAFAGDPYTADAARTRPQMSAVDIAGTLYPAITYRTNGAPDGIGDCVFLVQVSGNGGTTWADNLSAPGTTVVHLRQLQPDGSELVTVRTTAPLSSFSSIDMAVDWSAAGVNGSPLFPLPLGISTGATLPSSAVGVAVQQTLAAEGGAAPLAWNLESGALPAGLTLAAGGTLSGIPSTAGTFEFTVKVDDALAASSSRTFSLTVAPFEILTTSPLTNGQTGAPYSANFAASGGTAPFTWTISDGALPDGLDLSTSGVLSGTPTVSGTFQFTLQVQDTHAFTTTRIISLSLMDLGITTASPLSTAVVKVPYSQTLVGTGGAQPYLWSVISGALPEGLTLSAEGVLSGTPTAAGDASVTVQLTENGGFSITKAFSLSVSANFLIPVVDPIVFPIATVGADFGYTVSAIRYPQSFSITGLPRGLRYVAATGVISGRPAATGVYMIQVRARNKAGTSSTVTAPLVVKALPVGMVGSFAGLMTRDATVNGGLGGKFDLATTTKGSFSLKITRGTKTKTATGFLAASAPQISILFDGLALQITLDSTTGLVSGSLGGASLSGWRNTWNLLTRPASSREGYYSFSMDLADAGDDCVISIPQGQGYATFTVAPNGTLKIIGKSADGQTLSSSGFMGPDGQICLYSALYKGLGSLLGQLTLAEDPAGTFTGNTIAGSLTWMKPTSMTRTYAAGFAPINLVAEGAYLAASSKSLILGMPEEGTVMLRFTDGGLAEAELDPDLDLTWTHDNKVLLPAINPAKVALSINAKTGAVTGNFTLVEPSPALTRAKMPCVGQIVRLNGGSIRAVGHFLLPQIPTTGQSIRTSPILSGGLLLLQ
jgi:hypothetical protein